MLALFYAGVHELPVAERALFALRFGEFVFGLFSVAVLAVADISVRRLLADPFCDFCDNWGRTVFLWSASGPEFDSDDLRAHLLAHRLEYLEKMLPDGSYRDGYAGSFTLICRVAHVGRGTT
jgi:hypothetical protein